MTECARCKEEAVNGIIMSMFNSQMICPVCYVWEREHPKFPKAEAAVLAAEANGNMNFEGIGWPE